MEIRPRSFRVLALATTLVLLVGCTTSATGGGTAAVSSSPSGAPSAAPSPSSATTSGLTTVKIGITSKSASALYLYLGQDLGIYREHGIDAQIVIAQPGALVPGLTQGDLDFVATLPPAIQGVEEGFPIRGVMVSSDHPEYLLVGDQGVTSIDQLKGKQVSGSAEGQLPALMLQQLLSLDGLSPGDYQILAVSNDPARAAMVQNHQAAAGLLGIAQTLPLLDAGYPLLDTTLAKIYYPLDGLAVTLSTMQQNRDMVQRMVDATLEANRIAATDKPRAQGVLEQEFALSESDASRAFDLLQTIFTKDGRPAEQAVANQIQLDMAALKLSQPSTEDQEFDYSFLPPRAPGS